MLFNSIDFLFFFTIVTILYYLIPLKKRYIFIVFASYIFYMFWNVGNIVILMYVTLITYIAGRLLELFNSNKQRKLVCILAGILCFVILFMFKYYDFVVKNLCFYCKNLACRFLILPLT